MDEMCLGMEVVGKFQQVERIDGAGVSIKI